MALSDATRVGVGPRSSGLSQRRQYTAPKPADLSAWAAVLMRVWGLHGPAKRRLILKAEKGPILSSFRATGWYY